MIDHLKKVWKGEEKLWKVFWLWGVGGNIPLLLYFLDRIGLLNNKTFHYDYAFKFGWIGGLYAILGVVVLLRNFNNISRDNSTILKISIYSITIVFISTLIIGSLGSGGIFYTLMFVLGYLKNS